MGLTYLDIENVIRYASPEVREMHNRSYKEFNALYDIAIDIMGSFSELCGWRGEYPLSFVGFGGSHLEVSADRIVFFNNKEECGVVEISNSGRIEVSGEFFKGLDPNLSLGLAKATILSLENVSKAQDFTALGRMRTRGYVLRDAGEFVFVSRPGIPGYDSAVREFCYSHGASRVCLLPESLFEKNLENLRGLGTGSLTAFVRSQAPVSYFLDYNGESVVDVSEDYIGRGLGKMYEAARDNAAFLEKLEDGLNRELVSLVGLARGEDARELFHFPTAYYPFCSAFGGCLQVLTGCGGAEVLSVKPRDNGFAIVEKGGTPRLTDRAGVERRLRALVLSDVNVSRARGDLRAAGFEISLTDAKASQVKAQRLPEVRKH